MKKTIAAVTASLLLCLTCTAPEQPVCAAEGENVDIACICDNGLNISYHDYYTWTSPICSNLVPLEDGGWMRVQSSLDSQDQVRVEYYDAGFHLTERFSVPRMLPDYGGFYHASDGCYYLITGDTGTTPVGKSPKFDIAKYSTDWKLLSHVQTVGDDVIEAFYAGTVRCADDGKRMIIHTARRMQSWHQSNYSMELDMENMKLTYDGGGRAYTSHSFNQFVLLDAGDIVMLNHGDAHPRTVVLNRLSSSGRNARLDMVSSFSDLGEADPDDMRLVNYTGVAVGGFVQSSTHYIVAYNTINQDNWYDVAVKRKSSAYETARNIKLAAVPKDDMYEENILNVDVTDYPDDGVRAGNPYLVPVGGDRFLLIWSQGEILHYVFVDGTGALTGKEYEIEGQLSDCEPVVSGGKVFWYTWEESDIRFYSIDLEHPENIEIVQRKAGHEFEQTEPDAEDNEYDVCTKCGLRVPHDDPFGYFVRFYKISSTDDRWIQTWFDPETEYLETGDKFAVYIDKTTIADDLFFKLFWKGESTLDYDIAARNYTVTEFDAPVVLFDVQIDPLVCRNKSQRVRFLAKHNYEFAGMQLSDGNAKDCITLKCTDCGHTADFGRNALSGRNDETVRIAQDHDNPDAQAFKVLITNPITGEETAAEWGVDYTTAYVKDPETGQSYAVIAAAKDSAKLKGSAVIPDTRQEHLAGDVNADGAVNREDAVLLGKWLGCAPDTTLPDWQAGDMNQDALLDAADLTLLKTAVLADRV